MKNWRVYVLTLVGRILKNLDFLLVLFLVGFMCWFVNGVWFSENYAPPTRSVCWIGIWIGVILWIIYSLRTGKGYDPGDKAFSKVYRVGMAWIIGILNLAYISIPTYARSYVKDQGYWKISRVFSEDPGVYSLEKGAYPQYTFLENATEPFNLDLRGGVLKSGGCFVWNKSVTEQDFSTVTGFRCEITISYSYSAKESLGNIFALREDLVTMHEVDSLVWKELEPRVKSAASSGFGSCKLDTQTEVLISGEFDPIKVLNPRIKLHTKEIRCFYRLVQMI